MTITQIGYVSLVSPPAQSTAMSETVLTFAETVTRVTIQNNSNYDINVAFDSTASAGSYVVFAGTTAVNNDKQCLTVHLWTPAALNINGTSANGLVILGE